MKWFECMGCGCPVQADNRVSKVKCGSCRAAHSLAYARKYREGGRHKAAQDRFRAKPDFKEKAQAAQEKYGQTDKCKSTRKAYSQSDSNRLYDSERRKKPEALATAAEYRASSSGKAYMLAYRKKPEVKASKIVNERQLRSAKAAIQSIQIMQGAQHDQLA